MSSQVGRSSDLVSKHRALNVFCIILLSLPSKLPSNPRALDVFGWSLPDFASSLPNYNLLMVDFLVKGLLMNNNSIHPGAVWCGELRPFPPQNILKETIPRRTDTQIPKNPINDLRKGARAWVSLSILKFHCEAHCSWMQSLCAHPISNKTFLSN